MTFFLVALGLHCGALGCSLLHSGFSSCVDGVLIAVTSLVAALGL